MVKTNKNIRLTLSHAKYMILAIVIILLAVLGYRQFFATQIISADTTLTNFTLDKLKTLIVKNGAKLIFEGTATIEGTLQCEGGQLYIDANNDLTVSGSIICNRNEEEVSRGEPSVGIILIVRERAEFTKDSYLVSNAHVQIVEDPKLLLTSQEDFRNVFSDTAADTGSGIRIGPLFGQAPQQAYDTNALPILAKNNQESIKTNVLGDQSGDRGKGVTFKGRIAIGVSVG